MSTEIKFIKSRVNQFTLTYETQCADGNGWSMPCTIMFFYSMGKALVRTIKYRSGFGVEIDPLWKTSKKHKDSICMFLNETGASIKNKIKTKEYKIKKVSNKCNY